MTWRDALLAIVVLAAGSTTASAQDRRGLSDQQILTQIERDWDAAFLRNDVAFVESVLADDFIATYDDGSRGDKAKELKLVAEFNQIIESSTLDDFSVRIYGETAVVSFSRHLVGPSQGRRLEMSFRYTDVFVLRQGRWLCVSSHGTKITSK